MSIDPSNILSLKMCTKSACGFGFRFERHVIPACTLQAHFTGDAEALNQVNGNKTDHSDTFNLVKGKEEQQRENETLHRKLETSNFSHAILIEPWLTASVLSRPFYFRLAACVTSSPRVERLFLSVGIDLFVAANVDSPVVGAQSFARRITFTQPQNTSLSVVVLFQPAPSRAGCRHVSNTIVDRGRRSTMKRNLIGR